MTDNNFINAFRDLNEIISTSRENFKDFNIENLSRLIENSKISSLKFAKNEAVESLVTKIKENPTTTFLKDSTINAIRQQYDILTDISTSYTTPAKDELKKALIDNNFQGFQTYIDTLKFSKKINASDLVLLKTSPIFIEMDILPKEIPAVLKNMNVETARILSNSKNISYNTKTKLFYVDNNPKDTASILETNIICSSLQLLSGIDESDLISFLNVLENDMFFASEHPVGKSIYEIVSNWEDFIDFDYPNYYHARVLEEGKSKYTNLELKKAPNGFSSQGRFNNVGQGHFYFSDKQKGASFEVNKDRKKKRIQIGKFEVTNKKIKMVDLSLITQGKNKFLDYCRLTSNPTQYPNIKREYLLPCYFASCCIKSKIEGIKYYGSKEYTNYVAWNDSYFKCIGSEIIEC